MALPDPQILAEYEKIYPGFTAQLWAWVQKEGDRRHEVTMQQHKAQIADREAVLSIARRGQVCGLLIGLAAIAVGGLTATNGAPWPGAFIGGGGVIGLVSVFVVGTLQRLREDNPKRLKV
ncbi:MAG: DUF2335 domain-containing protein [Planctomycetes bacterium]|nr:DUF2335 domain-containing protein [Planctomycetota bacterium]